jgi:hypothetical protein
MALSAQQIIEMSNGGGGQQLFDMVRNGQASEADIRAALGDSAVDSFLARTNQTAPVPTVMGVNAPSTPAYTPPSAPAYTPPAATSANAPPSNLPPSNVLTPLSGTPTSQTPTNGGTVAGVPTASYVPPTQAVSQPSSGAPPTTSAPQSPALTITSGAPQSNSGTTTTTTGNAGGYMNPSVPGGTTQNTDYSKYPTPIPASPNYELAAQQQGEANLNAAKGTVALSNPNQINPFGSQTYTIGPDGRPVQTQQFSADQQQRLFDLNSILPSITNNIKEQTAKPISSYDFQKVLNPEDVSLKPITTDITAGGVNTISDALRAREQPRMDRARQQKEAQLLTRGFNPGTEGWNEAMDDLSRSENDFNLGLVAQSGQEQSRLFDLQSRARLQDQGESQAVFDSQMRKREAEIGEQVTARTLPIQEYGALVNAMTPQMPQFNQYTGATVEANPIFDATAQKGLFDLGRYGTSVQGELGTRNANLSNSTFNKVVDGVTAVGSFFGS